MIIIEKYKVNKWIGPINDSLHITRLSGNGVKFHRELFVKRPEILGSLTLNGVQLCPQPLYPINIALRTSIFVYYCIYNNKKKIKQPRIFNVDSQRRCKLFFLNWPNQNITCAFQIFNLRICIANIFVIVLPTIKLLPLPALKCFSKYLYICMYLRDLEHKVLTRRTC